MQFHKAAARKSNSRKSTRKNTRTPRKKAAAKKQSSPFLFFFGGIVLTLVGIGAWAYLKKPELLKELLPNKNQTEQVVNTNTSEKPTQRPTTEAAKSNDDEQLDYHQMLTNRELEVEKDPAVAASTSKRYVMQCGASKVLAQAESLKAQIAFIGLQAEVAEKDGWYRVRLGPYSSKRAAESDRHKLQNNDFDDCRIW